MILKFPQYAERFKTICRKIGPKMKIFYQRGNFFTSRKGRKSVRKLPIEIKTNPLIPKLSTNFKFPHSPPSNKAICRKFGQKMKIFHFTVTFDRLGFRVQDQVCNIQVEIKTVHPIPNLSTDLKFSSKNGPNKAICRKIEQKMKIFHYTMTFDIYIII